MMYNEINPPSLTGEVNDEIKLEVKMIKLNFVLSILGLTLDILGSLCVALGFFATKNDDLFDQASQYWGYNPKLFEALVDQRDKAILGFILIFIGSVCQFSSALISSETTILIIERDFFILLIIFFILTLIILKFHIQEDY